jgi:hypothetical protein
MQARIAFASALLGCASFGLHPQYAHAASADLGCKLKFSLSSWSVLYKHSEGHGTVTCANGKSMQVDIAASGGGLTVGKSQINDGSGRFTDVHRIADVLGSYAEAEAHAGAIKSADARVLTKGTVSLALAGTGEGIDLGIDVGQFTLSRAK